MAAAMTTAAAPLRSAVSRNLLSSRTQKLFQGKKLQLQVRVITSRNAAQRVGKIRAYRRSGATARPGNGFEQVQHSSAITHPETLYDLLDIRFSEEISVKDIKAAYRAKARQYHPDSNPPAKRDECTRKFMQVQEAYRILGDPELKADYDCTLHHHPLTTQSLKSAISFRRGKRRSHKESCAGSVVEQDLESKPAWRSQWSSQLRDLTSTAVRRKPGSWASAIDQKHQRTSPRGEANS